MTGRPGPAPARPAPGRAFPPFLRFCLVGAAGFCVDAGVLVGAMRIAGAGPLAGRLLSFAVAVLVTFELNRRWSFRDAAAAPFWPALAGYVGVQGIGFLCNLAVYAALTVATPLRAFGPLPALAAASAVALAVNYAGARRVVFRRR